MSRYRFAVTEISALTGRHYCRSAHDAKIKYIQKRHRWMEPFLPEAYRYNRTSAILPLSVRHRIENSEKISDEDMFAMSTQVPVVEYTVEAVKESTIVPPERKPKLLCELQTVSTSPKRKADIALGAIYKHVGKVKESYALEKYQKQTGCDVVVEQPWLMKSFVTERSNIAYEILGRADFVDSAKQVCEVKTRIRTYKYPVCDVDQCCLYSILTGMNARLVQQLKSANKKDQVMISDALVHSDMVKRWRENIKPKLDVFVESLEECYSKKKMLVNI